MDNHFYLETYDEDEGMKVQFHYWVQDGECYSSTELENGETRWKGKISEEQYIAAIEELHNA